MTADEIRFVLTAKADEQDVVHRNPREECNTDQAKRRQAIDPDTADALLAMGEARRCAHCYSED